MKLKDYQTQALTTAAFPRERAIEYCVLGLVGEVAELVDALSSTSDSPDPDLAAETGDVCWYLAVLSNALGIMSPEFEACDVACLPLRSAALNTLVVRSGLIANKAKKVIRDGKDIDRQWVSDQINTLWTAVASFCEAHDLDFDVVLRSNLDKLASRKARGVITGSGDKR